MITIHARPRQTDGWMDQHHGNSATIRSTNASRTKSEEFFAHCFEGKMTSLPKVIWEEGRVAALSHMHVRRKVPIGYNGAP